MDALWRAALCSVPSEHRCWVSWAGGRGAGEAAGSCSRFPRGRGPSCSKARPLQGCAAGAAGWEPQPRLAHTAPAVLCLTLRDASAGRCRAPSVRGQSPGHAPAQPSCEVLQFRIQSLFSVGWGEGERTAGSAPHATLATVTSAFSVRQGYFKFVYLGDIRWFGRWHSPLAWQSSKYVHIYLYLAFFFWYVQLKRLGLINIFRCPVTMAMGSADIILNLIFQLPQCASPVSRIIESLLLLSLSLPPSFPPLPPSLSPSRFLASYIIIFASGSLIWPKRNKLKLFHSMYIA